MFKAPLLEVAVIVSAFSRVCLFQVGTDGAPRLQEGRVVDDVGRVVDDDDDLATATATMVVALMAAVSDLAAVLITAPMSSVAPAAHDLRELALAENPVLRAAGFAELDHDGVSFRNCRAAYRAL